MFITNPARPDELKVRSGGACISILGLIAVAIGPCVFYSHRLIPGSEVGATARVAVGAFFLIVGLLLLFLRTPCVFDRRRRVIIDETRFLIPLHAKETPFDTFLEVEIRKEVRRSKNSTYTVYPVALKGTAARDLETSQSYETSRQTAEMLAQFMELPLIDYSTGTAVRREHDELNEPLAERLRRTDEIIEVPEEPQDCPVQIESSGSRMQLHIPKGRDNMIMKLAILILPVFVFTGVVPIMFMDVLTEKGPPPIFIVGMALFMIIPIGIVVIAMLRKMPAPQVVTITPEECRVGIKRPLFGKTHVLPTDQIEELVIINNEELKNHPMASLVPGRGIVIRTDKTTIEIGAGLDDDVKAYMQARILQFFAENC